MAILNYESHEVTLTMNHVRNSWELALRRAALVHIKAVPQAYGDDLFHPVGDKELGLYGSPEAAADACIVRALSHYREAILSGELK